MAESMSDERREHIRSCLSVPDVGGISEAFARELLAEVDRQQAQLARLGKTRVEWSVRWPSGLIDEPGDTDEACRERVNRRAGTTVARRIVGEWLTEDGGPFPRVCQRCRGSRQVPDWKNWNSEYGEPRPKPCPDCQESDPEAGAQEGDYA